MTMTDGELAARYKAALEAIASLDGLYNVTTAHLTTIAKEVLKDR